MLTCASVGEQLLAAVEAKGDVAAAGGAAVVAMWAGAFDDDDVTIHASTLPPGVAAGHAANPRDPHAKPAGSGTACYLAERQS
jgi:hypothetical protein